MSVELEIANRLERLRTHYVIGSFGAATFGEPRVRAEILQVIGMGPERGPFWTETDRTRGRSAHRYGFTEEIAKYRGPSETWPMQQSWANVLMLAAGDELSRNRIPYSPVFEFARHVRNAVAHGGSFKISHARGPATFDGIALPPELDGTPLYDFVSIGDLLALYDAVIAELRAGA